MSRGSLSAPSRPAPFPSARPGTVMSNVRGLSDLKGEDDDDKRRHNDYYAGGEKR